MNDKIDRTPKPGKYDVDYVHQLSSPTPLAPEAPESSSDTLSQLHDKRIDEMSASYAKMSEESAKMNEETSRIPLSPTDLSGVPNPPVSPPANVTPIHPGMPITGPRLDPMTEMLQTMGISFESLTQDRASPKGRAWDLLCACARRTPVDEETVRQSLKLALYFEKEWEKHEKLEAQARTVESAERNHRPPTFPGAER